MSLYRICIFAEPKKLTYTMKDLLQKFESKEPEIVFNWKDP